MHLSLSARTKTLWLFFLLTAVVLLSCIFADFSTKGEPREAMVAAQMLRTGDWVLPVDFNGDMSYKPPMFHWFISIFALLSGGGLSEFVCRLPSALSLIGLCVATWYFAGRGNRGLLSALVLATCFEVFRAGTNCRVDMLLAFFMAGAMMALYLGSSGGRIKVGWLIVVILLMSGGVLTKGPVAILLPLGVWWIWSLIERERPLSRLGLCVLLGLGACLLPLWWYSEAYGRGGDRFLSLAWEENFGRMLGSMTYDSHVKPFWYSPLMLLCGLLPWSAFVLVSLCFPPWRRITDIHKKIDRKRLFCIVAVCVVLIFFMIPKSKRGVYLLPLYPFAAVLIADYVYFLSRRWHSAVKYGLRSGLCLLLIYGVGYTVVWPIIVNGRSDRHVAESIRGITGNAPLYTYINSRMNRFYGVDYYLGFRMRSLLPSGQVADVEEGGYTPQMISLPQEQNFYIAMTEGELKEVGSLEKFFSSRGLGIEKVYTSPKPTRDMRSELVLFHVYSLCKR